MPTDQQIIKALLDRNQLEPYIRHIRFPQYKNLAPDTGIEFTHPITALVGANGTNKSSILRAMYGAPGQNNVGNFWFSTNIDPIEEGAGSPNCFIYGYRNELIGRTVEVLKTRIHKENDPDYWEPSRPLRKYNMEVFQKNDAPRPGASKTRWKTITKRVVYLDFRAALSAFDKFFYYGQIEGKDVDIRKKKDRIRARSSNLKKAIESRASSFTLWTERIINGENFVLNDEATQVISAILGRTYTSIKLIRHSFYNTDGYTAMMSSDTHSYTEAFAGSGEFSVINLVYAVLAAEEKSLILLDEPEVSLHPGAQERLMTFLAAEIKRKKHQVILSTHSPSIIRNLPADAIKLLILDSNISKVILPNQKALPEEAFFHLGEPIQGQKLVVVEDQLAKAILDRVIRINGGEAMAALFEVVYFPGGVDALWTRYAPIFASEVRTDVMLFLDGDQNPGHELPDPANIPLAQNGALGGIIKDFAKTDIKFTVDAHNGVRDEQQLVQAQKNFITWVRKNVRFLPGNTPEEFVWNAMNPDQATGEIVDADYKLRFKELTKVELALADYEHPNAGEILNTQKRRIASIQNDNNDFTNMWTELQRFAGMND